MPKKIGFSAGRCIRDILNDDVDYDNVVFIVTGTQSNTKDEWLNILKVYNEGGEFDGDFTEEQIQSMGARLWNDGKIHQPRNFGVYRSRYSLTWMDLVHSKPDRENNPVLKQSWEELQIFEKLLTGTNINLEE